MADVLSVEDLPGLLDRYPRQLVAIPEWEKAVWIWAYDLRSDLARYEDSQLGESDGDKNNRGMIARVIESARVSGELVDGKPPAQLFKREAHWSWLEAQPLGVIRRIAEVSQQLNGESFVTQEQMRGFFALLGLAVKCLKRTASACGSCTDCPESSTAQCPHVLSESLWLPTM